MSLEIERPITPDDNIRLVLDQVDYGAIEGTVYFEIDHGALVVSSVTFGTAPHTRHLKWFEKDATWREALNQISKQIDNNVDIQGDLTHELMEWRSERHAA